MKKKISVNIIVLFIMLFLYACGNAPAVTESPSTPSPTGTITPLPTGTFMSFPTFAPVSTLLTGVTPTYPPYHTPTPTDTATPTSTPDYAALGIPSPTPTPTFDYDKLSSFYLTPFTPRPTFTGVAPQKPTANVEDMLPNVKIRKLTPQFPPVRKIESFPNQDASTWSLAYIQSATDLMNYVDGNQQLYLQFIEDWMPTAFKYSPDDWFLAKDYDNDGQIEWLTSIPVRFEDDGIDRCGFYVSHFGFCPRIFFVFEKTDNSYYPKFVLAPSPTNWNISESRVALIDDLNNDGIQEIVFRADPCGSGFCSTELHIGRWDGQNWTLDGFRSEKAEVTFVDIDNNETTEILLKYSTAAADWYSPYPFREGLVDVYGWQSGHYELVDQVYPPTENMYAVIADTSDALEYKNSELAFKNINPAIETLYQSCDRMKTYVGIQAMLAYAFQGNSNGMKSTLAKLEKYCDFPRNAYVPAAKILWLAYEKSHDAIGACQAMERFLRSEYNQENGRWAETLFIDWYPTGIPSCPRE